MKTPSLSRTRARQRFVGTIMVPVDFSSCSLTGLKYAIKFAREINARLVVLHVTDLGPVMMTTACGDYHSPAYLEAARRRCDDRMRAFLKQVDFGGVPVKMFSVAGYCPAAIYEAAKKQRADLIILSTHGRTGLKHAFLGSVAEGTVRHSGCPVLVVPSFARVPKEPLPKSARPGRKQTLKLSPEPN
jgi:nucleotide-binding universal stress UspA family protein